MPFELVSGVGTLVYALWNGSSNNAPPSGWEQPTFDDSAWSNAAAATTSPGQTWPVNSQAVWSDAAERSGTDQCLFRHHFDVPSPLITATMQLAADDWVQAVYLNGLLLDVPTGVNVVGPEQAISPGLLRPTGNVLALWGANLFPFDAWVAYRIAGTTQADANTTGGGTESSAGGYGADLSSCVRLRHASGVLDWEHDGTLFRVRSGGRTAMQVPFPVTTQPPRRIMVQDPATGLPMWSSGPSVPPPPPPVSATYSQPDRSLQDTHSAPDPLPVPPSAKRVCGAAEAMATLTCAIYDAMVQLINKAKNDIIADFTQGLKKEISSELVSLLTEAEFAQWEIDALELAFLILAQIVETLLSWGTSLPLLWPPDNGFGKPVSQQYLFLRCSAFQALWLTGGDYLSRNASADGLGTKDYWLQYLAPQWSFFAGSTQSGIDQAHPPWQLVWLNGIIDRVADAGWAFDASKGAQQPSTACTACPGYPP